MKKILKKIWDWIFNRLLKVRGSVSGLSGKIYDVLASAARQVYLEKKAESLEEQIKKEKEKLNEIRKQNITDYNSFRSKYDAYLKHGNRISELATKRDRELQSRGNENSERTAIGVRESGGEVED